MQSDAQAQAQARAAVSAHLAKAFSLVDTPSAAWARAFLLDSTPQSTLSVVTNAAAVPFSVTSRSVDTAFETSPAPGREAFDSRFAFDALLVPSFSSGPLSVGVVVIRIVAVAPGGVPAAGTDGKARCRFTARLSQAARRPPAPPPAGDAAYKYSVGRWVRNELDGTLLIVKHTPDSPNGAPGGTQVMFLEHLSSTRRLRLYFHCDTAIFKQGRILDSVRACVTNTEARHCPICMQAPGANCSCKLVLIPPNFAFDYHGCAAAMQSQSGSYLGQAGITISLRKKLPPDAPPAARMDPNRPRRYVSAPLISSLETTSFCRSRCDATHDALAELLLNFAVQTSLKEANPSRTALPVPATRADDDDEEEDDGGDGDVVVAPETPSFSPGSARDAAGDTTAGSSAASVGSMGHLTDDEMLSFPAPPFAQSTDGEGGTAAALSSIMSDTPGSAAMDMTSSTDFVASCLLLDDYKPLEPLSLANASGADGEPFATIGGLEDLALNAAPSGQSPPVGAAAATEVTPSDASSVDASTESQQQFRRQQKARGVTDEELAAREARRKKKNRESAARANLKKKMFNDELKANIRAAQERAAMLQARQTQLVKENFLLRQKAGLVHTKQQVQPPKPS